MAGAYIIALTVVDDDGGIDIASTLVIILDSEGLDSYKHMLERTSEGGQGYHNHDRGLPQAAAAREEGGVLHRHD
jgi:hypothetical protein